MTGGTGTLVTETRFCQITLVRRTFAIGCMFAVLGFANARAHAETPATPAPETGSAATPPAPTEAPPNEEPKKLLTKREVVTVGAYLNDIQTIDLKLHNYVVDAYIWFRWKSPDVDPSLTFEFTNANQSWTHVRQPNYETPHVMPDGTRYQVVHVQGNFAHKFLLHNYPFDRQLIEVAFEDAAYDSTLLSYVADTQGLTVNEALILPGFRWEQAALVISDNKYPTNFGNPETVLPETYSRVTLRLSIQRPRGTYAMKLLLPVACIIICAALMFLLKPSHHDARWSIGITALLTIVALQITLNDDLPDVDYLVLMDKIYISAYLFMLTGLGVLVRAGRLVDTDRLDDAVKLDRRAITILLSTFLFATTVLVIQAIRHG